MHFPRGGNASDILLPTPLDCGALKNQRMNTGPAISAPFSLDPRKRVLETEAGISAPWHPDKGGEHPPVLWTSGIWDTGASITTLDLSLVERLGLKPIDQVDVQTAKGLRKAGVYYANVYLRTGMKSGIAFGEIPVIDGEILDGSGGEGKVLIGLDIISSGDFAVSNFRNEPLFTFRMPSRQRIDFTRQGGPFPYSGTEGW